MEDIKPEGTMTSVAELRDNERIARAKERTAAVLEFQKYAANCVLELINEYKELPIAELVIRAQDRCRISPGDALDATLALNENEIVDLDFSAAVVRALV